MDVRQMDTPLRHPVGSMIAPPMKAFKPSRRDAGPSTESARAGTGRWVASVGWVPSALRQNWAIDHRGVLLCKRFSRTARLFPHLIDRGLALTSGDVKISLVQNPILGASCQTCP